MLVTFGLPISVQFLSNPYFIGQIPWFLCQCLSSVLQCAGNIRGRVPIDCLRSIAKESERAMRKWGGGGYSDGKSFCAGVRAKLLWCTVYCTKPRPDPESHPGSWSWRVLGRQSMRIMREYDLVTAIEIRTFTQPHTFERSSSGFVDMSWLKSVSTNSASFPRMTSTERINGEKCFRFSWKCLTFLSLFYLSQLARILSIDSFL